MTDSTDKTNLLGMSQGMLEQFFAARDEKPFRARQLMQWIHQRGVTEFDEMTDLSKKLRDRLREDAQIKLPIVQSRHDSKDGTVKWLFSTDCVTGRLRARLCLLRDGRSGIQPQPDQCRDRRPGLRCQ
jgi:23S rRNA (adenine2503-C2)-methyltransferase